MQDCEIEYRIKERQAFLDYTILIALIQELSGVKYGYTETIDAAIDLVLRQHGFQKDELTADERQYLSKRTCDVLNRIKEIPFFED